MKNSGTVSSNHLWSGAGHERMKVERTMVAAAREREEDALMELRRQASVSNLNWFFGICIAATWIEPKTLGARTGRLRQRVGRPLWSHLLLDSCVGDPGTAVRTLSPPTDYSMLTFELDSRCPRNDKKADRRRRKE